MKKIKIISEKTSDGLWQMPMFCNIKDTSYMWRLNDQKLKLFLAIIVAYHEVYNNADSEIYDITSEGFYLDEKSRYTNKITFNVKFKMYDVIDDTLYILDNCPDCVKFLRKRKIENAGWKINI